MFIHILLERPFRRHLCCIVQSRVDGSAEILLRAMSCRIHTRCLGLTEVTLSRNCRQRFFLQHGKAKVTIAGLRPYCGGWCSGLFCPFHFHLSLLNSLPGSTLFRIGRSSGLFSFTLHLALAFCLLSTCLLLLASFLFLDGSTLSLQFRLSISFPLCGKFILYESISEQLTLGIFTYLLLLSRCSLKGLGSLRLETAIRSFALNRTGAGLVSHLLGRRRRSRR